MHFYYANALASQEPPRRQPLRTAAVRASRGCKRAMKKTLVLTVIGAIVAFVILTVIALEGAEVALLHTALGNQQPRQTRVWVADVDGSPWIEAANPEREFYRDILEAPEVVLERNGMLFEYRAVPLSGTSSHDLIRSRLRDKYGWADEWIGMLTDTSGSIAIRLEPR
jgi:hypothetical protein